MSSLLKVLSGETHTPPPIWFMRQAGRHLPEYLKVRETASGFIDFALSPEKAAEVTLQPIRRYDMDAAILFADILLVPLALGRRVDFVKGRGPVLDPMNLADVEALPDIPDFDRVSPVYETVKLVRGELAKDKALIGFCGGPWTVCTYLLEGGGSPAKERAKRFAYEHPGAMDRLLNAVADASAVYMIEQAKAGADALKIFESWAEGLSPAMFEKLVIKPTQRIIGKIREAGIQVPIIGFPRGAGLNAITFAHSAGIDGLAIGTDTSMRSIRKHIPEGMPLQGNLDPLALRIGGAALEKAVQDVLDDISGPHIFNLGHGVSPDVKIENVHAVINHVRTGRGKYV